MTNTPSSAPDLPVHDVADRIVTQLATVGAAVLTAPTGSGKTTQVPQILRHSSLAQDGQILVLQPRRMAARLVATRVAAELSTSLGEVVGYQTRHDSRYSPRTQILFLTEGLFLRRLMSDPQLSGVAAVLLDEFHERSLAADLALGLCHRLRDTTRPDLLLLVMSATLNAETVAAWLGCNEITASGRMYPVDIQYDEGSPAAAVWVRAAQAAIRWLEAGGQGDALVFMPGTYEIRRTIEAIRSQLARWPEEIDVLPLHGGLRPAEQDRAVASSARRKIIISTNVAETSITIDGIGCVIDAGLARVARYDPARGVNGLLVERISLASADQRAGRAGRTAPGTCLRLWPAAESHARVLHDTPEVARVDLAEAVLQLAVLGIRDAASFGWLDPPAPDRLHHATHLLQQLGALDTTGELTSQGRQMADMPTHPRLARLLLEAARLGVLDRAAVWAALISEREICVRPLAARYRQTSDEVWPSDLLVRERALELARAADYAGDRCRQLGLHAVACREVDRAARQLTRLAQDAAASAPGNASEDVLLARCLLTGFGDHVALRRDPETRACDMDGRRRVLLDRDSVVGDASVLVAVDLREVEASRSEGGGVHTIASLATAIDPAWIGELFPDQVTDVEELMWNEQEKAVFVAHGQRFGALLLNARHQRATDGNAAAQLILQRVLDGQLQFDRWDESVEVWLARTRCVAEWFPERQLVTYDADDLAVIIAEIVGEASRWGAVRQAPVMDHLRQALSWDDQQFIEKMAPERIRLPTGFGMRIHYTPGEPPRGRAKIQDLYDVARTPSVGAGRVPVLLEILAPNFRPAQVTDDLPGFWDRTYPELKKELKRRYPKHEWR